MPKEYNRDIFSRTDLLVGAENADRLSRTKVIIFGLGGVGSWCAESLVRSGIFHLTLVDFDLVGMSNINRQLMATTATVGKAKVEVLAKRLLDINPGADIRCIGKVYRDEDYQEYELDSYDYVIDCIDSLKDKASLILRATASKATLFSSMGAALKVDPQRIKVAEFFSVKGCPLGFALRKKLRRQGLLPSKEFLCVYDDEVLENRGTSDESPEGEIIKKAVINGTMSHITGIFGLTLAGLVIQDICKDLR